MMCHTITMKKIIFLLPVALLLTSCDVFKIGFVNEEHSAGIEGGASTSGQTYREDYSYFAGDAISTEGKSVANLTFTPDDGLSDISIEKVNEIATCDVDEVFSGAVDTYYTGTRENAWLFVGAKSSYTDGFLTLGFNVDIKDVVIEATPYYYLDTSWNEDELKIDANCCLAVNSSNYIRLSSLTNEGKTEVNTTACRYHLAEPQNQIKIKAGGERSFIKKITLYY